uniref:SWIM-type domain-containing protein n=2 Tax=Oreochromis niloticus TaxID=8128 RepID=A0A669BC23_ORENI
MFQVLHSQRLNELRPWVIVSTTGKVEAAHCTCMAGVAETCTHVAALLFKVEATVRIRGTKTVTDESAYWVLPGNTTKILPAAGHNIDFTSSAAQKKTLDENINGPSVVKGRRSRPSKRKIPSSTFEELSPVLDTLQKHSKGVCLSGLEKYYTSHTVKSSTLPLSLACLQNTGAESLGLTELQLHCVKYENAAKVTEEQAEAIEVRTRLQHKSPEWYVWCAGRITASMTHAVCATTVEKPAITVVNRVCYPVTSVYTVQTTWGLEHELDARHAYTQKMSACRKNLQVRMCGFLVNTAFPEVGASPDGLTTSECCGKGCLEIKCPFKYRSDSIQQALDAHDKDFCLELTANGLNLKKTHHFYSQVQTQVFVSNAKHCDLVVWTQKDMAVVRIFPDVHFWESRLKKAQEFFQKVCLPQLVGKHFSMRNAALSGHRVFLSGV